MHPLPPARPFWHLLLGILAANAIGATLLFGVTLFVGAYRHNDVSALVAWPSFFLIPFFVGLTVVMPVLGHATWHLYRRTVEPDPTPHPDYQPRERPRRSAADFPAALFPTRE